MPITQERMIALIAIADEAIEWKKFHQIISNSETKAAIEEFYAHDGNNNHLASLLLARIQTINSHTELPMLSNSSLETLITERIHFKVIGKHNTRSARSMRKKRIQEGESQ